MREYPFEELGYFSERECRAIRDSLQGDSFMNFDIRWSNQAGNCILVVATDYDDEPEKIKQFFLHCALSKIFELRRANYACE